MLFTKSSAVTLIIVLPFLIGCEQLTFPLADLEPAKPNTLLIQSTNLVPQFWSDWDSNRCIFGEYQENCNSGASRCTKLSTENEGSHGPVNCNYIATATLDKMKIGISSMPKISFPIWSSHGTIELPINIKMRVGKIEVYDAMIDLRNNQDNNFFTLVGDLKNVPRDKEYYSIRIYINVLIAPGQIIYFGDISIN